MGQEEVAKSMLVCGLYIHLQLNHFSNEICEEEEETKNLYNPSLLLGLRRKSTGAWPLFWANKTENHIHLNGSHWLRILRKRQDKWDMHRNWKTRLKLRNHQTMATIGRSSLEFSSHPHAHNSGFWWMVYFSNYSTYSLVDCNHDDKVVLLGCRIGRISWLVS